MTVTWTYEAPADSATAVNVTFTQDDPAVTHIRTVNAVFTDGSYDSDATGIRVSEVARGVEYKMALGVIAPQVEDIVEMPS